MRWLLPVFFFMCVAFISAGEDEGQVSLHRQSESGLEGWTKAEFRHSKGGWMNGTLVVKTATGEIQTFRAQYAFIIGWDFCRNDTCVVIQSQNAHGPYYWQLFEVSTGKLIETFFRYKTEKLPDWVKDFTGQLDPLHNPD